MGHAVQSTRLDHPDDLMPISPLPPRLTKPVVAVLLAVMLLGGSAMLFLSPARGYVVACRKAQQIQCALERETSDGTRTWQLALGADATALVRVEWRRRGGSRVFLYLSSGSQETFAAELEGGTAIADAQAAAAKLNRVFTSVGVASTRVEARPPAYLRWLAWGTLGIMALLVLAIYRELFRREDIAPAFAPDATDGERVTPTA